MGTDMMTPYRYIDYLMLVCQQLPGWHLIIKSSSQAEPYCQLGPTAACRLIKYWCLSVSSPAQRA
jgi:hypothetical protein